MNLIEEAWIPVRLRGGAHVRIAPFQLTVGIESDPIVRIDSPRADFNGALLELLIGLLQTEVAPDDRSGWIDWKLNPPSPDELHDQMARAAPWFNLLGDGARFMQSLDVFDGQEKGIGDLIIGEPPFEMIKKNTDLFVKRGRVGGLCQCCTAAALYTANAYSPAAGRGHRTSLRGGGPVTTVIEADPATEADSQTLWHLCWLNVLPRGRFESLVPGNRGLTTASSIYPWAGPTRTSEGGESTTPEDMSPYHVFWGMPRRIRLHDDHLRPGSCDICSGEGDLISGFDLRHGGVNYQGAWVHPLTPHSFAESGEPAPLHMPRGGLGYRNWAALTVGRPQRSARREAAAVVFEALQDRRRITGRARVHAFGFDVDNAKIRGWYGYSAPVYGLDEEANNLLRDDADNLILAADEVAGNLRSTLGKARATGKAPDVAIAAFYRETEPAFLAAIDRLATDLAGGLDGHGLPEGTRGKPTPVGLLELSSTSGNGTGRKRSRTRSACRRGARRAKEVANDDRSPCRGG